jgi:hypothetical protein
MKLIRPLAVVVTLMFLIGAAWIWGNRSVTVDMADYAPADSLAYLEFNSLTEVANSIEQNDTWKTVAPLIGVNVVPGNHWLTIVSRVGIGPADGVIFSRAQIALVVLGVNTAEQDDVLRIKPEVAIIAETHTSKWRLKPIAVESIKRLATFAYGQSQCTERSGDADYVECSATGGDRKIVGAIDGSLVVIGNSENSVRSCLETRHGLRPSIRTDPELLKARSSLNAGGSLGFGYVSSGNAAKLFSIAAPLLMGKAPGDRQLEQVLAASAGKILRGVAWTSKSAEGRIEDRYLFSLEPSVITRLEPAFETVTEDGAYWNLVPDTFQSMTIYRTKDPPAGWDALGSAVALKLDALSSVLFGSLLRSSLAVYGIDNPKEVLSTLTAPLLTIRPTPSTEGSVLLARVHDVERLRRGLVTETFKEGRGQILNGIQSEPDSGKEFSAVFIDDYVFIGKTENVRPCLIALRSKQVMRGPGRLDQGKRFPSAMSAVLTYANDEARLTSFITVMASLKGKLLSDEEVNAMRRAVGASTFSATETRLNSQGIERTTRSSFGQFSTILSLVQSDSSNPLGR